jgi:hypothetical protein
MLPLTGALDRVLRSLVSDNVSRAVKLGESGTAAGLCFKELNWLVEPSWPDYVLRKLYGDNSTRRCIAR